MNVDRILETFNHSGAAYILIGGMNYLLRHEPVLTFDVDLWVEDVPGNLDRVAKALGELDAEWGATDEDWRPVRERKPGWLHSQALFCLTSPHGAIDIFKAVQGLPSWRECRGRAVEGKTASGILYVGLCDEDMLTCQLALPEGTRKESRMRALREFLGQGGHGNG